MIERLFQLQKHGTTVTREVLAGVTTFAAMAYILAVHPQILSAAGMDPAALVTVTALASALGTTLMAVLTNYPIALAPGMGVNAFFTYTVCLGHQVPWQGALAMVFWNGVLFLALSVIGLRGRLVRAIPESLKIGIQTGIGLFIAFIGLKNAGLIQANEATFVSLGAVTQPSVLLAIVGLFLTLALVRRQTPGAILISIGVITLVGMVITVDVKGLVTITTLPEAIIGLPASPLPILGQLDLWYPFREDHAITALALILTFLFVDLFDSIGTLIGVSRRAGLVDKQGQLPKLERALVADSAATMAGACLGTSTVTSYIESAAGVESGGRTGLTGIVVAVLFLIAMCFTGLILAVPAVATAPALIVVGLLMCQGLQDLNWEEPNDYFPAILTALLMPMTFSITHGIAAGFIVYCLLMLVSGRGRQVDWIVYVLSALLVLMFALQG